MGVDYGSHRVGLALSDALGMMAHPYQTLQRRPTEALSLLADQLSALAEQEGVRLFVLGLPKKTTGEEGETAQQARELAELLEARGFQVLLQDERFSSVIANRQLREAGVKTKHKKHRAVVDQMAAQVILQSYLDAQRG